MEMTEYGNEYIGWDVDEYPRYERGRVWYVGMIGAGILLLIYAVVSANFLFAVIVIMFALVMYLSSISEPARIRFSVTDLGIRLGRTLYRYKEISRFWFIYEPPEVKHLYFEFKSPFRSRLAVDLDDRNPNDVRTALAQFLHEDLAQDEEPFADFIGRILKI